MVRKLEYDPTIENYEEIMQRIGPFTEPTEFKTHSTQDIVNKFEQLNEAYPEITHVYEIGRSVNGQPLIVIAIGKYPHEHHPGIPEFKYVANLHGNENSGRETLLLLAEVLLVNYGKNELLSKLVNETRIHLLPSMNPDGYEQAISGADSDAWLQGRLNANGEDFNRDFPDRLYPNEHHIVQPETAAVMNWTRSIPFVLSAGLHDGSSVVNFPYDNDEGDSFRESQTPDNDLFLHISYSYARAHKTMWRTGARCLYRDDHIQEPITNGGMQDWNYVYANCFEITIEMDCDKLHRTADQLKKQWDNHKFALLSFIEKVHRTIHGFVLDSETRVGIPGVQILLKANKKAVISGQNGDFWRLVMPGVQTVIFQHPLYRTESLELVLTNDHPFSCLNVSLTKTSGLLLRFAVGTENETEQKTGSCNIYDVSKINSI